MQNCIPLMPPSAIDGGASEAQALPMSRRDFLALLPGAGAAGLLACAPGAQRLAQSPPQGEPRPRRRIRAICFDLFTLFDPRTVVEAARELIGPQADALCEAWRTRQFEYSWLLVAAGQYADFQRVTERALVYASKARGLPLDDGVRRALVDAYSRLRPWPDARAALVAWQSAGLLLAPLSNYSPPMLAKLLENAGFSRLFTAPISTDAARTFKPDPRAYALGESTLGLKREEIAFAAFGGWDAAGAKWFGFPSFWLNRLGVPQEELVAPDATVSSLTQLAELVSNWNRDV